MLHKNIRKFLSNIGKKGGKKTSELHNMADFGKLGGLKKGENARKHMIYNEQVLAEQRKEKLSTANSHPPLT